MADVIEVLDAIMGSGKSTGVLEWCDKSPDTPFIYVTPLLSESEVRVVDACTVSKFTAPSTEKHNTKGEHLLEMLECGMNASISHVMYSMMKPKHLSLIKEKGYTVIMDEEVDFISPLGDGYSAGDFSYLEKINQITVQEDGRVMWIGEDSALKDTKYTKLASMCNLSMVYRSKSSNDKAKDGVKEKLSWFVTQLPMGLLLSAKRVILLTYLFKGSVLESFLKFKGVSVIPFTEVKTTKVDKEKIRGLIEFVGAKQMEQWRGETLSSNWYVHADKKDLASLSKTIRAVGNSLGVKSGELLWCTPASLAKPKSNKSRKVAPISYAAGNGDVVDGYASGNFLACSSRATNAYRDRTVMIHCYNRFVNLSVKKFLTEYGAEVNDDTYALSEMLQWLWRSAIREGKPIKVCILPRRMYKLLQAWLSED